MTLENQRESNGAPALVSRSESSFPAPRFTLQKRKVSDEPDTAPLTSVNSAFLCGLFADVAEVQSTTVVSCTDKNSVAELPRPIKRSRVSFSRSMVRTPTTLNLSDQSSSCVPNTASILDLIDHALSPTSTTEIVQVQGGFVPFPEDLNSSSGTSGPPTLKARDNTPSSNRGTEGPAFPHLPATISATSCNTLTRNLSDLQSSLAENSDKDSYGWFVEMDGEYDHETTPSPEPMNNDLAFKAHTAPKASNYDAELEWAKAADTVDDVLGDFF